MNEYDSSRMADLLEATHGLEETEDANEADVLLLNTCSIREKAQEKANRELEQKVRERTVEINTQKEELHLIAENLEDKNRYLINGLNYAGLFLIKNEQQAEWLNFYGAMRLLLECGEH